MLIYYQRRIGNPSTEKQNLDHIMRHLLQVTKEKTKVTMTGEPSSKDYKNTTSNEGAQHYFCSTTKHSYRHTFRLIHWLRITLQEEL
jgi:hypothetical protein